MFSSLVGGASAARRRKPGSKKKQDDDDDDKELDNNYYANLYGEDDEFYKKWAGPVLIGSIFPAILSILVIVAGELIINGDVGTCGYNLQCKFVFFSSFIPPLFLLFHSFY
jgi:hypothetical protein